MINQFETPILLIVFNRIDTTQRVFNEIRKQQPKFLYIAADGPRPNKVGEAEKSQQVRDIVKQIDWECELKTLFSETNLGCAKGPAKAITWFFENVEQGIILEDDCVPHPDFFTYCEDLLSRYCNNEQIMLISGDNFQNGQKRGDFSYYFSAYSNSWGWASWRRAWANYDFYLDNYSLPDFKKAIKPYFSIWNERQVWIDKFLCMKKRGYMAWDYQFSFHVWKNQGLCILPNVNLISNIGFGSDATHKFDSDSLGINLNTQSILPLKHPVNQEINIDADHYYYQKYLHKSLIQIIWRWVRRNLFLKPKFSRSDND